MLHVSKLWEKYHVTVELLCISFVCILLFYIWIKRLADDFGKNYIKYFWISQTVVLCAVIAKDIPVIVLSWDNKIGKQRTYILNDLSNVIIYDFLKKSDSYYDYIRFLSLYNIYNNLSNGGDNDIILNDDYTINKLTYEEEASRIPFPFLIKKGNPKTTPQPSSSSSSSSLDIKLAIEGLYEKDISLKQIMDHIYN